MGRILSSHSFNDEIVRSKAKKYSLEFLEKISKEELKDLLHLWKQLNEIEFQLSKLKSLKKEEDKEKKDELEEKKNNLQSRFKGTSKVILQMDSEVASKKLSYIFLQLRNVEKLQTH